MTDLTSNIQTLAKKASDAGQSEDAIRFAQAATNLANAMFTVANWRKQFPTSAGSAPTKTD